MKKTLVIAIIAILIIGMLGGIVNAASASVKASSSTVNKGDTVTITVSFGQKVSAAQFTLNFDANKLEYVSKTGGGLFNAASKIYGYTSEDGVKEDLSSVSFKFKAKTTGKTSVSVSGLRISAGSQMGVSASMGNSTANITIKEKTTTTNTNKKPTTKPKPNTTKEEPEKIEPAPNELIKLDDEKVKTLKDDESNIMVKGIEVAIADGVVLKVNDIKKSDENYDKLDEILKNISGNKTYFDISLEKDNEKVQPNGYVTVCIPIPEEYDEDSVKVYYLDEEKEDKEKYELMEGEIQVIEKEEIDQKNNKEEKVEEKYYTFTTNHFSIYALVGEEKEEPKAEVMAPIEKEEVVEQNDMIVKVLDFFREPIVLSVIIGLLVIIIVIQRIKISGQKD